MIDFISGNPDLPICTGRVHNQMNLPAWSLPGQSALPGFRSRELSKSGGNNAAGRSNHLVMDDTEGKIQSQFKSDHQHSQLSLGHITRIEDNLSLGFKGRYCTDANGARHLEAMRKNLYQLYMAGREPVPQELSPHWRGESGGKFKLLFDIPVWVTVAVLGVFAWRQYQLTTMRKGIEEEIAAIGKMTPPPASPSK